MNKIAILTDDPRFAAIGRGVAEVMGMEPVMIDPSLGRSEATDEIIDSGISFAIIHGNYMSRYQGTYVAINLANKGVETVLIGTSLGGSHSCAEEHFVAYCQAGYMQTDEAVKWVVQLLQEGRSARIQKEIEKVSNEAEERISKLRSMLQSDASKALF